MKNFSLKTKENSLLSSKTRTWRQIIFVVVFLCAVLFLGKDVLARISYTVMIPIVYAQHYLETSTATIPLFIRSRFELEERIHTLETELRKRDELHMAEVLLSEENTLLRSMLQASSTPRILAGVIARPPRIPYDTFIIDRGYEDGVYEFAPVYSSERGVLGYIRTAYPNTALVTLLSSPQVESTVYIHGPDVFATAYGEGAGVVRMSIPQGISIAPGDTVLTPSVEGGILGEISYVQSIPTEPEQHAYVSFSTPLQSVRFVSVGTRPIVPVAYEEVLSQIGTTTDTLFHIDVPESARFPSEELMATSSSSTEPIDSATTTLPL